jgi:hypothetical protein
LSTIEVNKICNNLRECLVFSLGKVYRGFFKNTMVEKRERQDIVGKCLLINVLFNITFLILPHVKGVRPSV